MDCIHIRGGNQIHGTIRINGAKNAALPLMCCALLTTEPMTFHNVPHLADTETMRHLLRHLGIEFHWTDSFVLHGRTMDQTSYVAPYELVNLMRASVLVLGPLLATRGIAQVSLPGGCAIGSRPIDIHLSGLQKLGATIELIDGYVIAKAPNGLTGSVITMPLVSVTATINLMMAACLAKGETVLLQAAREPEVGDVAACLRAMGALIEGDGTDRITVQGVSTLFGTTHSIIPDRIETGSYCIVPLMTSGQITLTHTNGLLLETFLELLKEIGASIITEGASITVSHTGGKLRAIDMTTEPYPGIPTDLQAQLMALMSQSEGASLIHETIFENRFMHVPELSRMGANIQVHGRSALVRGVSNLSGAHVSATDLRASFSLVLAGLGAEGETTIHNIHHLDRGYSQLEHYLRQCGADITRYPGNPSTYSESC